MKIGNDREERECICLEEHERLSELFQRDRLSFERERKRLIEENIAAFSDQKKRENLTLLQQQWDRILRGAGSSQNRFVMIQALFWDHFINVWLPALNEFKQELGHSPLSVNEINRPKLSLINKTTSNMERRKC